MPERLNTSFFDYELTPSRTELRDGTEFHPDDEVDLRMSKLISLDEVRARRIASVAAERVREAEPAPLTEQEITAQTTAQLVTYRRDHLTRMNGLDERLVA